MRVSRGAFVRAFSTGQVPAQPYVRGSSNRSGIEDSALDHAEGVRQCIRWLQRDADTIVQTTSDHPVRSLLSMRGL
jgi:hypothetical protein